MHPAFTLPNYTIKPKGLSILSHFRVLGPNDEGILYFEQKIRMSNPITNLHVYAGEDKSQELLRIQDTDPQSPTLHVTDLTADQVVGSIEIDWKNILEDAWQILDASGNTIATVRETSTGRGFLHDLTEGVIPQNLVIKVGGEIVAELRQKNVILGHLLLVDFSMDPTGRLDRRLGLAAAFVIAAHQGTEAS